MYRGCGFTSCTWSNVYEEIMNSLSNSMPETTDVSFLMPKQYYKNEVLRAQEECNDLVTHG